MSEKVVICGSRGFSEPQPVWDHLDGLDHERTIIITGGARGVDVWCENRARNRMPLIVCHAAWTLHGKAAGHIRNDLMLSLCDRVVAFWDGKSPGTASMIAKARAAGIPVQVVLDVGVSLEGIGYVPPA